MNKRLNSWKSRAGISLLALGLSTMSYLPAFAQEVPVRRSPAASEEVRGRPALMRVCNDCVVDNGHRFSMMRAFRRMKGVSVSVCAMPNRMATSGAQLLRSNR